MDFIDYYAVLGIPQTSTTQEIKDAYKKQALRWHPDKNIGRDTNAKMALINEAYLVLKNDRAKYDKVFNIYNKKTSEDFNTNDIQNSVKEDFEKMRTEYSNQAANFVKKSLEDTLNFMGIGFKAFAKEAFSVIFNFILGSIILSIIIKMCS